jgi:hypothetical protein
MIKGTWNFYGTKKMSEALKTAITVTTTTEDDRICKQSISSFHHGRGPSVTANKEKNTSHKSPFALVRQIKTQKQFPG